VLGLGIPRRARRGYPRAMDLPVQATLIGRIALGAFLGYVIGFEREYRGKPAASGRSACWRSGRRR
jgi:hypothetical protein